MNRIFKSITLGLACAASLTLASCDDSFIFEHEGDCDPHYKVQFKFDMNLHYADAFPNEVNAVTLYVLDAETGNIVWQKSESGDTLRSGSYQMDLDVAPGRYKLMAWCGEGVGTHFTVPQTQHHTGLSCTMTRSHNRDAAGNAFTREDLNRLYHGAIRNDDGELAVLDFPDDEGTYVYTIPLIKDTNDVNIMLQHLSGDNIDRDDFTFTITDANGSMDWNNDLLDDENITYFAHHKRVATAGVGSLDPEIDRDPAISQVSTCVAEHTVPRLMADRRQDCRLQIFNNKKTDADGNPQKVVDIPLIDYALMMKTSHFNHMTDQEYLDRQDKYDLVFFLDENGRWVSAYLYVLSWKVVIQNTPL